MHHLQSLLSFKCCAGCCHIRSNNRLIQQQYYCGCPRGFIQWHLLTTHRLGSRAEPPEGIQAHNPNHQSIVCIKLYQNHSLCRSYIERRCPARASRCCLRPIQRPWPPRIEGHASTPRSVEPARRAIDLIHLTSSRMTTRRAGWPVSAWSQKTTPRRAAWPFGPRAVCTAVWNGD